MKRCLSCKNYFDSSSVSCPACGAAPSLVDGLCAYAPEYSDGGGGFKAHYFSDLAKLEATNFWFRSRNQLIIWALKKYCPNLKSFLEIGCGTGFVLSGINKAFPQAVLHGSEIFTAGLEFSVERMPSVDFMQMDARNIPFYEEFDAIGAFDVLEHIEEDECVMEQVHVALKPNGIMLVTVPQHQWLWSAADEYACHFRRYSAVDLHKKIQNAGFQIVRSTSFVTSLLPAMMVSRLFQKKIDHEKFDASAELKISPWLNALFFRTLMAEQILIKKGMNFPVGGSRLVVARKL
ncbi:MAG: class I SAM-dependent methyltransferase [Gammaproteobacteria bacterium]|nr:class I SAM-dependent methyltransferase [Gammaproteobacteria bacterium]